MRTYTQGPGRSQSPDVRILLPVYTRPARASKPHRADRSTRRDRALLRARTSNAHTMAASIVQVHGEIGVDGGVKGLTERSAVEDYDLPRPSCLSVDRMTCTSSGGTGPGFFCSSLQVERHMRRVSR